MDKDNLETPKEEAKKPSRRRARKPDGKFKGDNPTTPEVNEAWEPTEVPLRADDKEVKYSVKPKIDASSKRTAGKYGKKAKTRPSFGKITSTTY